MEEDQQIPLFVLVSPRTRRTDLCWEALVRETAENPAVAENEERGRFNRALKSIRAAAHSEGLDTEEAIAAEIPVRAQKYRECFPTCSLTPTALAAHWFRVTVQQNTFEQARRQG